MLARNALRSLRTRRSWNKKRQTHSDHVGSAVSEFETVTAKISSKFQIYLSRITDPYLNLSIEHFLLQTTPSDSTILFLYSNRPCVIIGRNQNPWLEADLSTLTLPTDVETSASSDLSSFLGPLERVELVRRRSGGGTVFHGPGNVNYSVICPPEQFTRDAHAEMVASALRNMNPTARVNQRHDIVLDTGSYEKWAEKDALPSEASTSDTPDVTAAATVDPTPKKVSGSAFKLTRSRALHHGTCLLCSPHLADISKLLSSPAAEYIQARGVDSVRSPVANVLPPATDTKALNDNIKRFQDAVLRSFSDMYPAASLSLPDIRAILDTAANLTRSSANSQSADARQGSTMLKLHQTTVAAVLGLEVATLPSIQRGMNELRSKEWLFGQTPRFTISTHTAACRPSDTAVIDGSRSPDPHEDYGIYIAARAGAITGASYIVPQNGFSNTGLLQLAERESKQDSEYGSLAAALKGVELWKQHDWQELILNTQQPGDNNGTSTSSVQVRRRIANWMGKMLQMPHPPTT